jgi:hypothetical protein
MPFAGQELYNHDLPQFWSDIVVAHDENKTISAGDFSPVAGCLPGTA